MSDTAKLVVEPEVGGRYVDRVGERELEVTEIRPGDRLGREVLGFVSHHPRNGDAPAEYSTDLRIFAAIWESA